MTSHERARRHLEALAMAPRPAGGDAETRARRYCAGVLARAGMQVSEEPFGYSEFAGRYATPAAGALAIVGLLGAAALGSSGRGAAAGAVLTLSLVVLATCGTWLARRGVVGLGIMRRHGTNLAATRGTPAVWLVAHLDSKSQPIPILVRAGGIVATSVVWIAALGLTVAQVLGWDVERWWPWLAVAGVIAAAPIAASFVGARSPGALDDASGVATVLLSAEESAGIPLGVLLTSAEELGLAGARAWVQGVEPGVAINCDGVDDSGKLAAMYSGSRPHRLLESFAKAAAAVEVPSRSHRVLPGVLVDAVALADRGWEVVTLSRGSMRTLHRIHTRDDSLDHLRGDGIPVTAAVVISMVRDVAVRDGERGLRG
ncbi:MAG TPA: M28 family peptidase [Gemmatimonadaceae bacterium]|nr:M28 family peptidase [Gemmatimonadaceae bacterium]